MASTIVHGWYRNENSSGGFDSGPTTLSRPETRAEESDTKAVGDEFFRATGLRPCRVSVRYYGTDTAMVVYHGRGYWLDRTAAGWTLHKP